MLRLTQRQQCVDGMSEDPASVCYEEDALRVVTELADVNAEVVTHRGRGQIVDFT